jgi:hypothetical protein
MRTNYKFLTPALLAAMSMGAYAAYSATTTSQSTTIVVVPAASPSIVQSTPIALPTPAQPLSNAATTTGVSFSFGVQTHFSQGWSPTVLGLADQIGAKSIRDTVNWTTVEKSPGTYDFSGSGVQALTSFCARKGTISLTIIPQNALYDGGQSIYSDVGRKAFSGYINALLGKFGNCVSAIEIGNEINNSAALVYPAGLDKATTYVALLKAIYANVKPRYPAVAILGGSTNAIGTGFLETLFAAGALKVMDGVAVHPYRTDAEGLDFEVNHLRDVMRKYGTPVAVWATEFSYDTPDKRLAAAGLVKSAAQLSASGVDHAYWYALIDQQFFPNMGLFSGTTIKPDGTAYGTIISRLFPYGRAARVDTGDNLVYLYRFGANRWLVWGASRQITFSGTPVVRDILGSSLASATVRIGAEPLIVEGATGYTLGATDIVADTLLQYGGAPWSYFRRGADGKDISLALFDNDYTSYFGDRWSKPLRINNTSGAPAGDGGNPMRAVLRYTSPKAQQVDLEACFSKAVSGDGVDYRIDRNGVKVAGGILVDRAALHALQLNLAAGDRVDLIFGPNLTYGGDSFSYRAILSARGRGTTMSCS